MSNILNLVKPNHNFGVHRKDDDDDGHDDDDDDNNGENVNDDYQADERDGGKGLRDCGHRRIGRAGKRKSST